MPSTVTDLRVDKSTGKLYIADANSDSIYVVKITTQVRTEVKAIRAAPITE